MYYTKWHRLKAVKTVAHKSKALTKPGMLAPALRLNGIRKDEGWPKFSRMHIQFVEGPFKKERTGIAGWLVKNRIVILMAIGLAGVLWAVSPMFIYMWEISSY